MKKFVLTAAAGVLLALAGTSAASAHGCHREAEPGKYGWHRHAGPYCERVSVERRHWRHRDEPHCRQVCTGVGPLRFCERKCR